MTTQSLDEQIVDASSLISLLLVFVFAYFAAVLPQVEELRHRARPTANDDRLALIARLGVYEFVVVTFLVIVMLVFALLVPLSALVVRSHTWGGPFDTLRAGLLLVELLLTFTAAGLIVETALLRKRKRDLR